MGDSKSNYQKYGVPLYGACWVPSSSCSCSCSCSSRSEEDDQNRSSSAESYIIFTGGGGEGRSGIPNAVMLSHFDSDHNSLSDQPLVKLGTGSDLPYRLALHPDKDGLICAMSEGCRLFEWEEVESDEVHKLGLKVSDNELEQLKGIGQQKSMAFNREGSLFAVGGEDGNLRVFKWPSLELIIDKANVAGKDLDFSSDSKFLVTLGASGPCRVWDVTSASVVASLTKENDEIFGFCRFSRDGQNQVLYVTVMKGQNVSIVTWDTTSWKKTGSKKVVRDPVSAFNVSADGKLLAIGTVQGDIWIFHSNMRVHTVVKKAHLVIVTALAFSPNSRALASASLDSSARVTLIEDKKKTGGINIWIVILFILLAIAAFYGKQKGLVPYL